MSRGGDVSRCVAVTPKNAVPGVGGANLSGLAFDAN